MNTRDQQSYRKNTWGKLSGLQLLNKKVTLDLKVEKTKALFLLQTKAYELEMKNLGSEVVVVEELILIKKEKKNKLEESKMKSVRKNQVVEYVHNNSDSIILMDTDEEDNQLASQIGSLTLQKPGPCFSFKEKKTETSVPSIHCTFSEPFVYDSSLPSATFTFGRRVAAIEEC
jgi:hypothetical protein